MDSEALGIKAEGHGHSSSLNSVELSVTVRVDSSETVITVGLAGGEWCRGGDGDLEAGPGAAPDGGKASAEQGNGGATAAAVVFPETDKVGFVVVDMKCASERGSDSDGDNDSEKMCRICHLSPDCRQTEGSDLIQLGCGCKDELGSAHRHCAETWFKLRGNRCCEICGRYAKNLTGVEDISFMEEWSEGRILGGGGGSGSGGSGSSSSEGERCWRGQSLCNFLMACLVIAFILPWFFRVNMF